MEGKVEKTRKGRKGEQKAEGKGRGRRRVVFSVFLTTQISKFASIGILTSPPLFIGEET